MTAPASRHLAEPFASPCHTLTLMPTMPGRATGEADVGGPGSTDELLERAAAGDEQAFAGVYDALSSGVFGTCLSVLKDRDHAAEVTQEVMLELWRTAARFDRAAVRQSSSMTSWVTSAAWSRSFSTDRHVPKTPDASAS